MFRFVKRFGVFAVIVVLAVSSSGCVDFEKQTAVFVFPKDGKSVEALFVYEGLHVHRSFLHQNQEQERRHLTRAKNDLKALVEGDFILLGETAVRIPLKAPKNAILSDAQKAAYKLLGQHVTVHQGMFLLSKEGKWSYCQPVTIHDPKTALVHLNRAISAAIPEYLKPSTDLQLQMAQAWTKAANEGHDWIQMEPGRFSLTLPGDRALFTKMRQEAVHAEGWNKTAQMLAANPWSIEQRPDRLTLSLGWGNNEPVRMVMPGANAGQPQERDGELFNFARTLNVPVRPDVSVQDVLNEFERTGKLPGR